MTTEWTYDADAEWEKIEAARGPWAALKSGGVWPGWVDELDIHLKALTIGEEIMHVEYGCSLKGAHHGGAAVQADGLWVLILTRRYVLLVEVAKEVGSRDAEDPVIEFVPRSAIAELKVLIPDPPQEPGEHGLRIRTQVKFEGIERLLLIPSRDDEWFTVPEANRLEIYASLRDDYYLQRV